MTDPLAGRRVEQLDARAFVVPTDAPEADGTATWAQTTVVLARASSGDETGLGWTYGPRGCVPVVDDLLAPEVVGTDVAAVPAAWTAMNRAARNATVTGIAGYAISAVDTALWDLKARVLGTSLAGLFGALRDEVPIYGSGGFTTYDDERTREQVADWVRELGIPRVKIKIGESDGTEEGRDQHRARLVRETIGPDAELYVDANGGYTAKQALRVMTDLADLDIRWLEEPVSSEDLAGLALVRSRSAADVAAGEYGPDVTYFRRMCAAGAVDCLQVDATRAGGYTGWFRAAAVAAAYNIEVSAHCAPHLHAPAAAATPNLRHVEWFHDHQRIEARLLQGGLDPSGGVIRVHRDRPGHGYELASPIHGGESWQ